MEDTMTILIDSASPDDLAAAAELGFVGGFTTNPILMARQTAEPLRHFERLLTAFATGPAFYQPTGDSPATLCAEARLAAALAPERVIIKAPATASGIRAAADLIGDGVRCALTAVYSPAQALLAHEVGCEWAIPYVDRAARQSVGGCVVVDAMAAILAQLESSTRILAASLKSPQQIVDAVLSGADDITAALDVLRSLPTHPLSEAAVADFDAAAQRP